MPPKEETKPGDEMSVTLSVLTKFIKPYNGDRETLPAFLTNGDNAMSLASAEQQKVLCKFILSQLEGKAQVACSLKTFSSWNEIKTFLRSAFGEKKHASHLLIDLQNCKQSSTDDVTKYSLRIESILTKMQSDIHFSCKNQDEIIGRIAAMEELALNTFLLGLNPAISNIVRCRNPTTLNEAVQHAIEEEKLHNLYRSKSSSLLKPQKHCSVCDKYGHNTSECFKNKKPQPYKSFHVNSTSSSEHLQTSNPKKCNYCKNLGHTIQECRKLQYNKNRQTTNSQGRLPNFTNTPNTSNNANVHFCESQEDNDLNMD